MSVTQNYTRSVMTIAETQNDENNNNINEMATLLEGIDYNLSNRTLVPISIESDVAVAGDEGSQKIKILVDKYVDGTDLSQTTAQIAFENAKGETGAYTIPRTKDYFDIKDEAIIITWKIDSRLTKVEGDIHFQVRFITTSKDDEGRDFYSYLWQSKIQTFKVLPQIIVDGDATPVDYTEEIKVINKNPSNIYSSLVDEDLPIDIVNREIGRLPQEIIIKGDTKSQVITFKLPRWIEGIDVYEKIIAIKYVNANGEGDRSIAVNKAKSTDGNYVTFCWLLDSTATAAAGKLQFAIEVLGYVDKPEDWQQRDLYSEKQLETMSEEEIEQYKQSIEDYEEEQTKNVYVWQSKVATINVLNGIEIAAYVTEVNKDFLTNWTIRSEGLLQTIEQIQSTTEGYKNRAETAKTDAESAKEAAETAKNSSEVAQEAAEKAQGAAETAQGAAETAQGAAETAQEKAESARDTALNLLNEEEGKEGAITLAVRAAEEAQMQAVSSASVANEAATKAESAKGSAESSAGAAAKSASDAQEDAESASGSANAAESARDVALGLLSEEEGKEGAITLAVKAAKEAQGKSESAKTASETAKKDAVDAKDATNTTYNNTVGVYNDTVEIKTEMINRQTWFMIVEEF